MKKYFKFLHSLLRHKWFVFLECCKLGVPWLGIIHDWTKFLPSEFLPYARKYHGGEYLSANSCWRSKAGFTGRTKESVNVASAAAYLHHYTLNKHHLEHWSLRPMPTRYRLEMMADWVAVSKTYGVPAREWYLSIKGKSAMHATTSAWLEDQLNV